MIRVLYINPVGFIGGAEKSLLELASGLDPDEYKPLVAILGPGDLSAELAQRGIACRSLFLPGFLRRVSRARPVSLLLLPLIPFFTLPLIFRLISLSRSEKIEIIHTNGLKAHLLGIIPALATDRPLIWHFRNLIGGGSQLLFRLLAALLPVRIIANSRAVKERLGNLSRIRVVYNGVDEIASLSREERNRLRRQFVNSPDDILIGAVGHFAPLKGFEDLLRAVPAVRAEIPGARFLFIGGSVYPAHLAYRSRLEDLITRLGVEASVNFTGERDDLDRILPALDIFVLPSRSEGFGRSNLEAMAAGLPVVSTLAGGIPEVVEDNVTGLLVPPADAAALSRAIITLARDPNLRREMGAAGRQRARLFSPSRMVAGVEEIYRQSV